MKRGGDVRLRPACALLGTALLDAEHGVELGPLRLGAFRGGRWQQAREIDELRVEVTGLVRRGVRDQGERNERKQERAQGGALQGCTHFRNSPIASRAAADSSRIRWPPRSTSRSR